MADIHSKETRSFNMSRIKGKDTKPEIQVRKFLHSKGLRFRIHHPGLPGKPDVVLPKYKSIVFVHGCFWHGHESCKYFILPKTNPQWWKQKITNNKMNDAKHLSKLTRMGYAVHEVWECQLKSPNKESFLQQLVNNIRRGGS